MKNMMKKEDFNKSGIYKIVNTHTNRVYIGQTIKKFLKRCSDHKRFLLNNKHHNSFLQRDYNKCKEELEHNDFLEFHVVEVMENCSKEQVNEKEEYWISQYFDNQEICYNFKEKSEAKERSCFSKTPEETKKKISEATIKLWKDPDYVEKVNHNRSIAMEKIMSEPDLKEKWIKPLIDFREKNPDKVFNYKNYWDSLTEDEREKAKEIKREKAIEMHRNGTIPELSEETIRKISEGNKKFIEENPLYKEKIINQLKNASENAKKATIEANTKVLPKIIGPDGTIYENEKGVKAFAEKHNLNKDNFSRLINSKIKKYKGWKLFE